MKRPYILFVAGIFCLAGPLFGQMYEEFRLMPAAALKKDFTEERIRFYSRSTDDRGFHRVVFNVVDPTVSVYHSEAGKNSHVAFVLCPGGAYHGIEIDREGHAIARYFQNRGYTVAVLKYRLPNPEETGEGLPYSQQDALAAIRFLRDHAADWSIAADRVGIMGASAGGHLAGSTAVFGSRDDGSRPDFIALLYPVVCMAGPCAHKGSSENLIGGNPPPQQIKKFSLDLQAKAGMPPFFIVQAKDDATVPVENSQRLAAALKTAGVPVKRIEYDAGGHGFSLGRGTPSDGWKDAFETWLSETGLK